MLAGLLLAGGGSTRFGSDKALAEVGGRTLLSIGAACLREACDGPIVVASGDGVSRPGVGDFEVADLIPDAGPLSAIAAGMLLLHGADPDGHVAVLAVDHVAPSAALLRLQHQFCRAMSPPMDAMVAEVGGRYQPLQAVWALHLARDVARAVRSGQRSVMGFLEGRDVGVLDEFQLVNAEIDLAALRDVDRPEDLPG